MSALIKHSQEINYSTPSLNLISHGRCLVYFELKNNENELAEVSNYCKKLSSTFRCYTFDFKLRAYSI